VIFAIPQFPTLQPIPSLGNQFLRRKPIIPIVAVGPTRQLVGDVLVDTGADDIVLPLDWAKRIGIDVNKIQSRAAGTVAGLVRTPILYSTIILRLTDGNQVCRWRAMVGFAQLAIPYGLFGIANGIEYFQTTFNFAQRRLEMLPQPHLPLTSDPTP
jgi:hypothetical protein